MIRHLALAAALALGACASSPQDRAGAVSSADATAAARETARLLIGDDRDIFEDVSVGESPRVRHRASGLVCRFIAEQRPQGMHIFPGPLPRGQDVGCQLPTPATSQFHTLYATRYPEQLTLDQAMDHAVQLMRNQHPSLKPYEGPGADVALEREGLRPPPASRTARFRMDLNGEPHLTRVDVAVVNGWVIKQRFTTPLTDDAEEVAVLSDLLAGLAWSEALLRFTNGDRVDRAPPPATGMTTRT